MQSLTNDVPHLAAAEARYGTDKSTEKEGKEIAIAKETQKLNW